VGTVYPAIVNTFGVISSRDVLYMIIAGLLMEFVNVHVVCMNIPYVPCRTCPNLSVHPNH